MPEHAILEARYMRGRAFAICVHRRGACLNGHRQIVCTKAMRDHQELYIKMLRSSYGYLLLHICEDDWTFVSSLYIYTWRGRRSTINVVSSLDGSWRSAWMDDRIIVSSQPQLVGHMRRKWWRVGSNDAAYAHEEAVANFSHGTAVPSGNAPEHASRCHHVFSESTHYACLAGTVLEDGYCACLLSI